MAKLNKESLGKIKSTEEAVHLFWNSASKFWGEGETNLQERGEKLNYDMLTLISNIIWGLFLF